MQDEPAQLGWTSIRGLGSLYSAQLGLDIRGFESLYQVVGYSSSLIKVDDY